MLDSVTKHAPMVTTQTTGFVPICCWFNHGELEYPVAGQCRPPMEKVVAGQWKGLAMLAGSRTVVHGTWDVDTPGSSSHALPLGAELLGA